MRLREHRPRRRQGLHRAVRLGQASRRSRGPPRVVNACIPTRQPLSSRDVYLVCNGAGGRVRGGRGRRPAGPAAHRAGVRLGRSGSRRARMSKNPRAVRRRRRLDAGPYDAKSCCSRGSGVGPGMPDACRRATPRRALRGCARFEGAPATGRSRPGGAVGPSRTGRSRAGWARPSTPEAARPCGQARAQARRGSHQYFGHGRARVAGRQATRVRRGRRYRAGAPDLSSARPRRFRTLATRSAATRPRALARPRSPRRPHAVPLRQPRSASNGCVAPIGVGRRHAPAAPPDQLDPPRSAASPSPANLPPPCSRRRIAIARPVVVAPGAGHLDRAARPRGEVGCGDALHGEPRGCAPADVRAPLVARGVARLGAQRGARDALGVARERGLRRRATPMLGAWATTTSAAAPRAGACTAAAAVARRAVRHLSPGTRWRASRSSKSSARADPVAPRIPARPSRASRRGPRSPTSGRRPAAQPARRSACAGSRR